VRLRQGEVERLLAELQARPDWAPSDQAAAWSVRGEAELAEGRPEQARQSFERAAALQSGSVDPLIGLVRAAMLAKQNETADAALDRGLALAPANPVLLGLKGTRAFADGDYAAAEQFFRRQISETPQTVTGRLDLAQALIAQARDRDAEAELSAALAVAPAHPEAHYLAAVVALRRGDYAAAAAHAANALKSWPQHLPSRAIAAAAAAELGRWEEARAHLDAIRASDPDHPLIAELLPQVREAMAPAAVDEGAGLRPLEQDLALFRLDRPSDPKLLEALGAIERGTVEARTVFRHELVEANDAWAARGLALAEHRAKRPIEARFALQTALARSPEDSDTRLVLAELYLLDDDPDGALPHLRQLARERPRDAGVLNNLAWVMYLRGELREAHIVSERALALAPRDPRILDTRGVILLRAGEPDRALELLGRAAGSDAAPPEARIHLAQALIQRGQTDEAKDLLTRTLSAPEDASAHRAASILLEELEP
jgi:tetratricopeptide (TPR) repeat protein